MKIMISVGEASGDMHTASMLKRLVHSSKQEIEAFGMGGNKLAAAGMELIVNNQHHSVMGLVEVLQKYPQLKANLRTLESTLANRNPDVLLLVDYPQFNMQLAAAARTLGIPVVYFIAPKVWASRPGRIQKLAKIVDHMAVILPFELKIFADAGIPTTFVGNPLLDNLDLIDASKNKKEHLTPRVALMPGSRKSEITNLIPSMLAAAKLLQEKHTTIEFVLPIAETIDQSLITKILTDYCVQVTLITAQDYKTLASCKAAIVASGTATLELAILGVPMTVAYKMNRLSYAVLKRWLTIEHISLTNIIAGHEVVPELIQDKLTQQALFEHTDKLLCDETAHAKQQTELLTIYQKLGSEGACDRLCELINTVVVAKRASI